MYWVKRTREVKNKETEMALEPFVQSQVIDQTFGLSTPPIDTGYNIAGVVYTPYGPVEKTKVSGVREFVQKYLSGATITAADHISSQFAYKILEAAPMYISRACPVTFLEGISSLGASLLFDKSFRLVDTYYTFRVENLLDSLGYYYVRIGDTMFASFDTGKSFTDIPADEKDGVTQTITINSDGKSLDTLFGSIMTVIAEDNISSAVISSESGRIVTDEQALFSKNVGLSTEMVRSGFFNRISKAGILNGATTVSELDFISINASTYYFSGQNVLSPAALSNPIRVTSPDNRNTMAADYFFIKVIARSGAQFIGSTGVTLNSTNTAFNLEFVSSTIPAIVDGGDGFIVLLNNDKIDISDGAKRLVVDINGVESTFVVGSSSVSTDISISLTSITAYDFLTRVIDRLIQTTRDGSTAVYNSSSPASVVVDPSRTLTIINPASQQLGSNVYAVTTDADDNNTYTYFLSTDANNELYISFDFAYIKIGNYFYFTGAMIPDSLDPSIYADPATVVNMKNGPVTESEFISLLGSSLYATQQIGMFNNGYVSASFDFSESGAIVYDPTAMEISTPRTITQSTVEQFAMVQKFPAAGNAFRFQYEQTADDNRILRLNTSYKDGVDTETVTVSFVPGVVDPFGVDMYYTRYDSPYFQLVNLSEGGQGEVYTEFTSQAWGSKTSVPAFNNQYVKEAWQELPQYEDGIKYDLLTDCAIMDPGVAATIESVANTLFSFYPASVPPYTGTQDILSYVNACNFTSFEVTVSAMADRIGINGFSNVLPGALKIILSLISLHASTSIEFAPQFGRNNGTVGVTNLVQKFTKAQREVLLNKKVRTLRGNATTGFYINTPDTAQPRDSYMSDEQIVRSVNKAVHVMEVFAEGYIAEYNNDETRSLVQEQGNNLIQETLFRGRKYAPVMYNVVCNAENNPTSVIDNSQLVIELYASFTRAIRWIKITHFIVPLAQATPQG